MRGPGPWLAVLLATVVGGISVWLVVEFGRDGVGPGETWPGPVTILKLA